MSYRAQLALAESLLAESLLAESLLAERLGDGWRQKLKEMSREEEKELALELMDKGVRNAFALVKALEISSQTLRRLLEDRREAQGGQGGLQAADTGEGGRGRNVVPLPAPRHWEICLSQAC
jgi:hypothetical protein